MDLTDNIQILEIFTISKVVTTVLKSEEIIKIDAEDRTVVVEND